MNSMSRKSLVINREGYYTVEGAFTITIFVVLFLMFISIIRISLFELGVQRALNDVAMKISEYSYYSNNVSELSDKLNQNHLAGGALCETLFLETVDVPDVGAWLKKHGVEDGLLGLNFSNSEIDFENGSVNVEVTYSMEVNGFGIVKKNITIKQQARTNLWSKYGDKGHSSKKDESTIWQLKPTERGKQFVQIIKNTYGGEAVASGQGIDLYFKDQNALAEIHSMNLYEKSYTSGNALNNENITRLINQYADTLLENVDESKRLLDMEDGSRVNFSRDIEKRLIIIFPKEVESNSTYRATLDGIFKEIEKDKDIKVVAEYLEEAFPSND